MARVHDLGGHSPITGMYGCWHLYAAYAPLGDGQCLVKIGMTASPDERIATLYQVAQVRIVFFRLWHIGRRSKARLAEMTAHESLRQRKSHGEWFMFETDNPTHKAELKDALHKAVREVGGCTAPPVELGSPQIRAVIQERYATTDKAYAAQWRREQRRARALHRG